MALSSAHGFPLYTAAGAIWRGWALAAQGHIAEGLTDMTQGLTPWRAAGARQGTSWHMALLAAAYGQAGQPEAGLRLVAEALAMTHPHGEQFYEAELYRVRGELLLVHSAEHAIAAETSFQQARTVARHQEAKSLELRAAMSLARLWLQQGKRAAARELLAPLYGWFTEGFDTADLRDAQTLLSALVAAP